MKKKGFTLVELLAVIAILAILVIVAMPNVLGMFSSAKVNTFVTEVQKYMDTAKTAFVQTALNKPASAIVFTSETVTGTNAAGETVTVNAADGELDMDGSKEYYIAMDRHGNFTRVLVWDASLCFDSTTVKEKGEVKASMVKDSDPGDGVTASYDNTNHVGKIDSVNGCTIAE